MAIRSETTLAVTLGDPAGVGPEVALAAIVALARERGAGVGAKAGGRASSARRRASAARVALVGDAEVAREAAARLCPRLQLVPCTAAALPEGLAAQERAHRQGRVLLPIVAPGEPAHPLALRPSQRRPGHPTLAGARLAFESIRTAVALARAGLAHGICTAPISKEWFGRAGVARTGHTEILAELAGAPCVRLMMAVDRLRVVLATSHLALRDVPTALSVESIADTIALTARHLTRWWSIARPRIAVAALNPHASDGGVFGDEEQRLIAPAVRRARRARIDALGPLPADTLFSALGPRCDAVVAMYHDQGLIPIKQLDVHRAVNVTLGLPFVRTSPDHGTAFDLAGSGRADAGSMRAALALALDLVERSRDAAGAPPSAARPASRTRPRPAHGTTTRRGSPT